MPGLTAEHVLFRAMFRDSAYWENLVVFLCFNKIIQTL